MRRTGTARTLGPVDVQSRPRTSDRRMTVTTVFANALTDTFKGVMDNPTIPGVIDLVVVALVVGWAMNSDKPSAQTPSPPPPTEEQKEKDAVEAALKAYKETKEAKK